MPAAAERAPKRGARGPVAAKGAGAQAVVRQLWRRQADRRVQAGLLCESRRDTALADTESKAATKVNQGHEHGYGVSSFENKNKCTPSPSPSLICPKAKSATHCLTELFSIYQNKHCTTRRRDDHIVISSSQRIISKID